MAKIIHLNKKRAKQSVTFLRQQLDNRKEMKAAMADSNIEDVMIEHHQDILQNIEFAIISCCKQNTEIDDVVVADALKAAILAQEPIHQLSIQLLEALQHIRDVRTDVPDSLWSNGLSTVLKSVKRHSSLQPGSKKYIKFVSQFII